MSPKLDRSTPCCILQHTFVHQRDRGRPDDPPAAGYGLFGLAVAADSKALADTPVRYALAMAIDRKRIVQSFGVSSWQAQVAVLPTQLDSNSAPAALEWVYLDQAARIAKARGLIKGNTHH